MSDKLRTALKEGGRTRITIRQELNGDFSLEAVEDWCRLTRVRHAVIRAEELEASEDPDELVWETARELAREAHINREVW